MCDLICGKCEQPAKFKCERCFEPYCSSECQVIHWPEHKHYCYKIPSLIPVQNVKHVNENTKKVEMKNKSYAGNVSEQCSTIEGSTRSLRENGDHVLKPSKFLADVDMTMKPRVLVPSPTTGDTDLTVNWKKSFTPSNDFFKAIVQFIDEKPADNVHIVWITDAQYHKQLHKLLEEMNNSIKQDVPMPPADIQVGSLVAAPFEGILYRAEIINVNVENQRAIVRLIDYGNVVRLPFAQIFAPIPIMSNLNAFVIRVLMPEDCGPLEIDKVVVVRIVGECTTDGCYKVECIKKSIPLILPLEELRKEIALNVVKYIRNGRNALVRLNSPNDTLSKDLDTVLGTKTIDFDFKILPDAGSFVAARTESGWRRCRLLNFYEKQHSFLVYALDDGFICLSPQIKRIPNYFLWQPIRVFAISISPSEEHSIMEPIIKSSKKLLLKVISNKGDLDFDRCEGIKHLNCVLYDDTYKLMNVIASVFTGVLDELKLSIWHESIEEGCGVYLSHIVSYKEVYIAAYTTKDYEDIIGHEMHKCAPFEKHETVSIGDIVLVVKSVDECFRGEIKRINDCKYEVFNIDRGYELSIERDSLRKPSTLLRSLPVRCALVKLLYLENIPTSIVDNKALDCLEICMKYKVQFDVNYSNSDTIDLIFCTDDKESLSKKLLPKLFEPRIVEDPMQQQQRKNSVQNAVTMPPTTEETAKQSLLLSQPTRKIYTLNDVEVVPIECGDNIQVYILDSSMMLQFSLKRYITGADYSNKKALNELETNLKAVSAYCKGPNAPQGSYVPKKTEICLAIFKEDGEWYRAVCLDVQGNDVMVMFLDYGNMSKVDKSQIKPIIKELMFPSNANTVYIEGIKTPDQAIAFVTNVSKHPVINAKIIKLEEAYLARVHNFDALCLSHPPATSPTTTVM